MLFNAGLAEPANKQRQMVAPDFLNVDLDIESKFDPNTLRKALGRKVLVLIGRQVRPGCFLLCVETSPPYNNPDETICAFCSSLERLSPQARRVWDCAYKKEFNIGHDMVRSQLASQFSLRTETLKRVAGLGATLGITFYDRRNHKNSLAKSVPAKRTQR